MSEKTNYSQIGITAGIASVVTSLSFDASIVEVVLLGLLCAVIFPGVRFLADAVAAHLRWVP